MGDRKFPFDGRNGTITAPNTSVSLVAVPDDRVFVAQRVNLANHSGLPARIRMWDSFTDSDGAVHDAIQNPVLLLDEALQDGESIELLSQEGIFKAIGTVIARSTQAGADPNDVTAGAWGVFES
jgi:hypothetical protein